MTGPRNAMGVERICGSGGGISVRDGQPAVENGGSKGDQHADPQGDREGARSFCLGMVAAPVIGTSRSRYIRRSPTSSPRGSNPRDRHSVSLTHMNRSTPTLALAAIISPPPQSAHPPSQPAENNLALPFEVAYSAQKSSAMIGNAV